MTVMDKQYESVGRPIVLRTGSRSRRLLFVVIFPVAFASVFFFGFRWLEHATAFHPVRYDGSLHWKLPERGEDVWMTTRDNVKIHGWFIRSAKPPADAAIIYFHGNAGTIADIGWVGSGLANRGFDVLLAEYRGYGRSEGEMESEDDLYAGAEAAYSFVRSRGVEPKRIVLYGASLGSAAAIDVASRNACGAVIAESGISSASDVAKEILPWLPRVFHRLARNRFDSVSKIGSIRCPVLVTHGDPDDVIPAEQGRKLFAAANEPKRLLLVPGAGHNVAGVGGGNYLETLSEFIRDSIAKKDQIGGQKIEKQ